MAAVVSCAGNNELAKRLHDHMISEFSSASTDFILLNEDEITLQNKELGVKNNDIRKSLGKFVGSSPDLVGYTITEFGDIFTIGIQQSLDKVILACEMCGYIARHESETFLFTREHTGLCSFPSTHPKFDTKPDPNAYTLQPCDFLQCSTTRRHTSAESGRQRRR